MTYQRILLDLNTQSDFFDPDGSCFSPAAERVVLNVYRLFLWAKARRVPVISTVLRLRRGERSPLAGTPHCTEGGRGETKLPETLLPNRINLGMRNTTDVPPDLFERYQQVIIETRYPNIFEHARVDRLITELPLTTFILCGTGLTTAICQATMGLLSRGFDVTVASDAVLCLDDSSATFSYRCMTTKGAVLAPTTSIVMPTPTRREKYLRVPVRG